VPTSGAVEGVEGFFGTPQLARVRDYTPAGMRVSLEATLERLGLDRIDAPSFTTPMTTPRKPSPVPIRR
jgi:D-threo-aldose 1-dehydrogenase